MSTPTAKRRRLDNASHTLSKPFKSPLKTPLLTKDHHSLEQDSPGENSPELLKSSDSFNTQSVISAHTSTPTKVLQNTASRKSKANINQSAQPSQEDAELTSLLKTQRSLESELRDLREELETLEQALRIELSGEDEKLEGLVHKWKTASREAADEMFTSVRDRVNRMGGPAAWREMQRKKAEWSSGGFDKPEEKKVDSEGEEAADVEKRDLYAEYDIDSEESKDKQGGQHVDEGKEDDVRGWNMCRLVFG